MGPSAFLLMLLVLTLIILLVIWCYRHALVKLCRPVFQVTNTPTFFQQPINTRELRYTHSPGQPSASIQIPSDSSIRDGSCVTSQITTVLALQDSTSNTVNTLQPTITLPSIAEAHHFFLQPRLNSAIGCCLITDYPPSHSAISPSHEASPKYSLI